MTLESGLASECDELDPDVVKEKNKLVGMAQNNRFLNKITPEEADVIIKANTIVRPRTAYPLLMGKKEIPYRLWKHVKGWAEENGYTFNYSGDMGSMRHGTDQNYMYQQDEPVTAISWYDAIVWCTAASEILGCNRSITPTRSGLSLTKQPSGSGWTCLVIKAARICRGKR